MQFLVLLKLLLMIKSKKHIKKWHLNIILIEIEINHKYNNNKLLKCLETLIKHRIYLPILKKENFMILEE